MILTMKRGIFITKSLWVSKGVVIQVVLFVDFTNQKYCWCREGFIWKKSCEISQLWTWPLPPPLKVVKSQFFFTPWPENHCKIRKILTWKPKKNFEKSQYLGENHLSSQSILVRGYPYPLYRKILLQIWMN